MEKRFFPSSKKFWVLHISCWGALYVFIIGTQLLVGKGVRAQVFGGLIYIIVGAFGGLLYRYLFYALGWHKYSLARVAAVSTVFAVIDGLIVAVILVAYVLALTVLAPSWLFPLPKELPQGNFLVLIFVSNAINIFVFQAFWSAIYVAIVTYRRSIRREIESLKLENSLKEAQLNILSSQLNPHFLFNALNNIRFMMRKEVGQAEEMLTHLSDLLRYALESSRSTKVTVNQELEIVENYICLAQIQFDDRLNYSQKIERALSQALLPPMMLQMLIENAVKHGMEELKEGGQLALSIAEVDGELQICVRNDFNEKNKNNEGFGLGLNNIEKRLHLIYGNAARLETQTEGRKWMACLILPLECAEN